MILPEGDEHFKGAVKKDRYQDSLVTAALKYCSRKRVAIDVGAHVGFVSRQLCEHFDKVIAFEPVLENCDCFRENCPEAELIKMALGDTIGVAGMHNPKPINSGAWEVCEGDTTLVTTPDSFPMEHIDLIKIDTQGSEAAILRGARKTLRQHRPVLIVECAHKKMKQVDPEVLHLLEDYTVREIIGRDIIAEPK